MTKIFRSLFVLVLMTAASAGAVTMYYTPEGLTGDQEVPPPVRVTEGTGFGTASFDPTTLILSVNLTWEDLTAPATASHIHCCSGPGANSGVAIDFVPAGFPNAVSGSFSHDFDLDVAASFGGGFLGSFGGDVDAARAAVIAGLDAGLAYFNIHTATYPAGEIRGDIQVVPEPGSVALIALGLGVVLIRRRFV